MSITRLLSAAAVAAGLSQPALADAWPVDGRLEGDGEKAEDLSGIACDRASGFPRTCLVVDDETQWAQWVTLEEGRLQAGDILGLIDDSFAGKPLELDGEGVAFADGAFYVIGSHGAPRTGGSMSRSRQLARLRADSHLFRITPEGGAFQIADSQALTSVILAQPELRGHAAQPLEENGVTIEGLAVLGADSFIGFREPVLGANDRAALLQVTTASLFGGEADAGRLNLLELGPGRGVRDLAAFEGELLVLAGPGPDQPGPSAIYRWTPGDPAARLLADLPCAAEQPGKPEAILPLDAAGGMLRILVLTDGTEEGDPHVCALPWAAH